MPQSSSYSKRPAKASGKTAHSRPSTSDSTARHISTPPKAANQTNKSKNSPSEKKRRAPSSSVSSVSSVSCNEELSDEADDSDDDADDEEDRPLARAPSYGRPQGKYHKTGRQPTKHKKRRTSDDDDSDDAVSSDASDFDESSDDVYAAVDYITDADDEDQDVEKLEEMMIMESESEHRVLPTSEVPNDQWAGTGVLDDQMILPAASFFDEEQLYSAMDTFGETDLASEAAETPVTRRVHFEERSDSSSDSDSHTDDEIPSDFLQQDSLDPQLRRMIESDNEGCRNHRRQSEELFGDADYGHGNIYHVESEDTSVGSLSGYESMLAVNSCFHVLVLILFQPTMEIRQMKTFHPRQPSLILDPSFASTPLTHLLLRATTRAIASPVGEGPSWELLSLILTSPWRWSTAQASTWSSFRPTLRPATTG